jgi:hypothetical protein
MTDVKFGPNRFDKYNLMTTNLKRLMSDLFWVLSKDSSYTEAKADALLGAYLSKLDEEDKALSERVLARSAEISKFEDAEYTKCFMATLLPVVAGTTYDWGDTIKFEDGAEFALKTAIGSGSYDKNPKATSQQIASKWLTSPLRMWCDGPHARHPIKISFKLR